MTAEQSPPMDSASPPLWWRLSPCETAAKLNTSIEDGLSRQEAASRLTKSGSNVLPVKKKVRPLSLFLNQFNNLIVWILAGAAGAAVFLGEHVDAFAIFVILILNGILGFVQEFRAEKSLEALKKMYVLYSRVKRGGAFESLAASDLVEGDLVLVEAGDRVPADGRIIESAGFAVDEAPLTGESSPVKKDAAALPAGDLALADRKNMVYMGTMAVTGRGLFLVTATGIRTELGRIADLLSGDEQKKTPLQESLEQVGRRLVGICMAVIAVVFAAGLLRGHEWHEMIMTSLSLAVAAIPEGLPAVVTISLAIGVTKMARRNALVRRLMSVETLGSASVICTDKTGTLTANQMTVRRVWIPDRLFDVTGTGYRPEGKFLEQDRPFDPSAVPGLRELAVIMALCNNSHIRDQAEGWCAIGDPTEAALITLAFKAGLTERGLEKEYLRLGEVPFDSDRKRMSVLTRGPSGEKRLCVKGAPDIVLERCSAVLVDGCVQPLDDAKRRRILEVNSDLSALAMRVLAAAYKIASDECLEEKSENDLVFAGLAAMMDPPREEARRAVHFCIEAGIRPVMITGDHRETALAVASLLGMDSRAGAMRGQEIDALTDEELIARVNSISVYARISAEHKLRIVKAWKARGEIVAVTGDGINDAPAIRQADIGCAMGRSGTDVTKEAADLIITDDNFASIVNAVEEGRNIYANITKFVKFLLSFNLAEILVLFIGILAGLTTADGQVLIPLSAVQILWMNLVTDGLPALALAVDPPNRHTMRRPPRRRHSSMFTGLFIADMSIIAAAASACALAACLYGARESAGIAQTMALTALVVIELAGAEMVRIEYRSGIFSNPWLILALAGSLLMHLAIIYVPPLARIFGLAPLGPGHWTFIIADVLAASAAAVVLQKLFHRLFGSRRPRAGEPRRLYG